MSFSIDVAQQMQLKLDNISRGLWLLSIKTNSTSY